MVLTSPVIIVIVCVGTPSRRGGPGAGASPGIKKQPSLGGLGKRRTTNENDERNQNEQIEKRNEMRMRVSDK